MAAASFTTRALALCGAPGADALQLPTDNRSYRSRPVRLRIPLQAEHWFRSKPNTDSTQAEHRFRSKPNTDSAGKPNTFRALQRNR